MRCDFTIHTHLIQTVFVIMPTAESKENARNVLPPSYPVTTARCADPGLFSRSGIICSLSSHFVTRGKKGMHLCAVDAVEEKTGSLIPYSARPIR
jgi:hypothetical protein